ncbi:MAG: PAS domain S-box protein [Candidatus Cyclobacteriaceae bacterium M3_2C_046]
MPIELSNELPFCTLMIFKTDKKKSVDKIYDYQGPEKKFSIQFELLDQQLLKITLIGKMESDDGLLGLNKLDEILNNLKLEHPDKNIYVLADVALLDTIDLKTRKSLQSRLIQNFRQNLINYMAVVSPNYLLLTMGAHLNKIRKNTTLSFYKTESEALKRIFEQRSINNDVSIARDFPVTFFNETWFNREYIYFRGKKLEIQNQPSWNYKDSDNNYHVHIFLIEGNIIYFKTGGFIKSKHILLQNNLLKEVTRSIEKNKIIIIADFLEAVGIQNSAKKLLEEKEQELKHLWERSYLLLSKPLKMLFKLYNAFRPGQIKHWILLNSLTEALQLSLEMDYHPDNYPIKKLAKKLSWDEQLKRLSKDELIDLINQLKTENDNLRVNHQGRVDQLLEVVNRLSWEEDFKPSPLLIEDEEDIFYNLFNAVSVLQQDVFDMLEELKELNRNLEQKVKRRTFEIMQKEANFSSLLENTKDLICSLDKDYNVLVANKAYRQFIKENYQDDIKPGDNILKGLDQDIINYWKPFYDRALNGETFETVETRFIDNKLAYYEILFNPIRTEQQITGFSVFIREITQQKQAEETIRNSQQLLSSINQNINEGIYRSNEKKQLVYVNRAFVELFGFNTAEEIYATSFADLYEDPMDREKLIQHIKNDNKITNSEIRFKRKDGSKFWGLLTSIRTVDEKGNEYYDGAIRDITNIKATEEKLKRQNEELKKVNNELDRFVYSASHDLRAPLLSILGLIGVAKLETQEAEKGKCLSLMEKSIKKLDSFIQDIISYSRNKRLIIKKEKINWEEFINEVFDDLKYLRKNKNIEKRFVLHQEHDFYSDLRRLKIVFYNLVSNAIIYSSNLRDQSFVEVQIEVKHNKARIEIADNGQGIPEIHLDKVFNMFYRASEEEAGSGLGLYIVKETLLTLNGQIEVVSEVRKGTSFFLELPSLVKA